MILPRLPNNLRKTKKLVKSLLKFNFRKNSGLLLLRYKYHLPCFSLTQVVSTQATMCEKSGKSHLQLTHLKSTL